MIFSKVVPRPLGMLKQVFLGRFEPVVTRFGPWKMPQCLENGPLWDQNWVQNGLKTLFFKSDPRPFRMHKQVFLADFEPVVMHFGPWKIAIIEKSGVIKPSVHAVSASFHKTRRYTKVVCCVVNLCTRFFRRRVRGDQTVHAVSATFRKTRRYTKVVCCVGNLCTRFFHRRVRGDQTVHAMSASFRKTRRYTKVVCCVLHLCTRVFHQKVRGDQTVHAVSARFRKTRRYTKVVCCVLHLCTRFFHRRVRGDQTVHAVSARFRKTRRAPFLGGWGRRGLGGGGALAVRPLA